MEGVLVVVLVVVGRGTKTLQQCSIRNPAGVPPSHGYQWCLTCSTAGKTDMAAPLLFPYVWDTVQQMHKSSLAIYFCSAYHVEKTDYELNK